MRAATAFTATTSFAAPAITPRLLNANAITTPAMTATAMAAAVGEVWHQYPGHRNEHIMKAKRNIAETGS